MSSPWIEGVRSVALNMPDVAAAERFYTQVWNLDVAHRTDDAIYLRGSGSDAYLLALHPGGDTPQIRHVTLRARTPMEWVDKLRAGYAPVLKAFGALDAARQKALRGDLLELVARFNRAKDSTMLVDAEYLEVVVTRR